MKKSTERFTHTVDDYVKYRPNYPPQVLEVMINECDLTADSIIADIGSGTGLLAELWLKNGNQVYGVEPNVNMRKAGEEYLRNFHRFISVGGTAEATTLSDQSVDVITVGTAFHWFDPIKTKQEFRRIIRSKGWILLIWNVRDTQSRLMDAYERLMIQYGIDYGQTGLSQFKTSGIESFFSPNVFYRKTFSNPQKLDWEGLQGRLRSGSHAPTPESPNYRRIFEELKAIFDQHQQKGCVDFLYRTELYYGHIL